MDRRVKKMDDNVLFTYDLIDPNTGEHMGRRAVFMSEIMEENTQHRQRIEALEAALRDIQEDAESGINHPHARREALDRIAETAAAALRESAPPDSAGKGAGGMMEDMLGLQPIVCYTDKNNLEQKRPGSAGHLSAHRTCEGG